MEALLETTTWNGVNVKNGVYLMEGDRCYAFRNYKGEIKYFTKPMTIDKRGRTFKKLDKNPFESKASDKVEVKGSKGETYYVDPVEKTCTCSGFKFRGKCRHIEGV